MFKTTSVDKCSSNLVSPMNELIEIPITKMSFYDTLDINHRDHIIKLQDLIEMRLLLIDKINEGYSEKTNPLIVDENGK